MRAGVPPVEQSVRAKSAKAIKKGFYEPFGGEEILVVKQGNRLSVMPVALTVARKILGMAGAG